MKNLYQLLRQKELDLERVHREVTALRAVVPLLAEGNDLAVNPSGVSPSPADQTNKWPLTVGGASQAS
jgi:hypothetical protein